MFREQFAKQGTLIWGHFCWDPKVWASKMIPGDPLCVSRDHSVNWNCWRHSQSTEPPALTQDYRKLPSLAHRSYSEIHTWECNCPETADQPLNVARAQLSLQCCRCCFSLSCVQLFAIPWTVARQAPLSMGFSRQEYWSGSPLPSPGDLPDQGVESKLPGSPPFSAAPGEVPWNGQYVGGEPCQSWLSAGKAHMPSTAILKHQKHTPLGWPWVSTARLKAESLGFCN